MINKPWPLSLQVVRFGQYSRVTAESQLGFLKPG